ncbi:hypothetical protein [Shinella zoogloeoides]|uniref:hypothetical protein n=1 Tax=Shinella zoogloeoides TaxID=352475 RepID=UPI00273E8325|nr:hypothetical protein [Shinella zoogloeoides]WLR93022.1 hypothetical protein Q9316_02075 [Shinella zoogloeoides]
MTKTLNTTFAAALVAASVFGASAAIAGDDYYQGVSPQQVQNHQIDRFTTQSIRNDNGAVKAAPTSAEVGAAQGDYYQGVSKHQ